MKKGENMRSIVLVMGSIGLVTYLSFGNLFAAEIPAKKVCFNVDGMACSLCPVTVKAAIKKVSGVKLVDTSFDRKEAVVDYDPKLTGISDIKKAIDDVGYKASEKECKL